MSDMRAETSPQARRGGVLRNVPPSPPATPAVNRGVERPTGIAENFEATLDEMLLVGNVDARERSRRNHFQMLVDALNDAAGEDRYRNPMNVRDAFLYSPTRSSNAIGVPDVRSLEGEIFSAFAAQPADFLPGIPRDAAGFWRWARQQDMERLADIRNVQSRATGLGTAGGFAGGVAGAFADPVNLVTLPVGGGGRTVAARIIGEGLVNAGVEAVSQPFIAQNYRDLGQEYGMGEAVRSVGFAFGAGVAFRGAIEGAPAAGRRLANARRWVRDSLDARTLARAERAGTLDDRALARLMTREIGEANLSPDERAALDILNRSAEISEASPFRIDPAEAGAHEERLAEALSRLIEGRPLGDAAADAADHAVSVAAREASAARAGTGGVSRETPLTFAEPFGGRAPTVEGGRWGAPRSYGGHTGRDYAMPRGTPVHPTAAGTARFVGWQGGYGWRVEIDHGGGFSTTYSHLDGRPDIQPGQAVTAETQIGAVGSSGGDYGNHLHYEMIRNGRKIEPFAGDTGVAGAPPSPRPAGRPSDVPALDPEAMEAVALGAWDMDAARPRFENDGLYEIDVRNLLVDAEAYQFRTGGDARGVTAALSQVTEWDPNAAGLVFVHERLDGSLYVADGHQRTGLARRLMAEGHDPIAVRAIVWREEDGIGVREAMIAAAQLNLKANHADAADLARLLRIEGTAANRRMVRSAALWRDGQGLAQLSDEAWGLFLSGYVPDSHAAIVGRVLNSRPELQVPAMTAIREARERGGDLTNRQAEGLVGEIAASPTVEGRTGTLFGDEAFTGTLLPEKARIRARSLSLLARDRAALERAAKNKRVLEGAGSRIADIEALQAAAEAGNLAALIERLSVTPGNPVFEALNRAAIRLSDGETLDDIAEEFLAELVAAGDALASELGRARAGAGAGRGGDTPGDGGRAADAEQALSREPERGPRLDEIEAAGQGRLAEFDDPGGQGAGGQLENLNHDADIDRAADTGSYRLDIDGEERSLDDILNEADADEAAASAARRCLKGGEG
jgi:murein DD-endopeptidase MepM/ murein hydrolase activator NlpD